MQHLRIEVFVFGKRFNVYGAAFLDRVQQADLSYGERGVSRDESVEGLGGGLAYLHTIYRVRLVHLIPITLDIYS